MDKNVLVIITFTGIQMFWKHVCTFFYYVVRGNECHRTYQYHRQLCRLDLSLSHYVGLHTKMISTLWNSSKRIFAYDKYTSTCVLKYIQGKIDEKEQQFAK